MPPKFIYFDLGNVLLKFSHPRMCRQIADLFGVEAEPVRTLLFDAEQLQNAVESGSLSADAYYQQLCQRFGSQPQREAFERAASDIFEPNHPMVPVITQLVVSRQRIGLLSNINQGHWDWICQRYCGLYPEMFEQLILSYEVGAMKPDAKIFEAAIAQAGVEPGEIFYTDDIAGHVQGAQAAGIDAVQFTSTDQLVGELIARGVAFNY